jgi:hypothetical protein
MQLLFFFFFFDLLVVGREPGLPRRALRREGLAPHCGAATKKFSGGSMSAARRLRRLL